MAKILVAEDEESVRSFVCRALEGEGHEVKGVPDGSEALRALSEERYDLLVTDIVMPGLDGIALALKTTKDYPEMPVLLMTGYSAEQQRAHNMEELVATVLLKPFSLRQICDAVAEALPSPG